LTIPIGMFWYVRFDRVRRSEYRIYRSATPLRDVLAMRRAARVPSRTWDIDMPGVCKFMPWQEFIIYTEDELLIIQAPHELNFIAWSHNQTDHTTTRATFQIWLHDYNTTSLCLLIYCNHRNSLALISHSWATYLRDNWAGLTSVQYQVVLIQ